MTRSSSLLSALVLIASMSVGAVALAEPSAADVESAKIQYREGKEFRDKGDLEGALARFKAAYALVPTPITALEVGRMEIAAGRLVEGRATLLAIERMPKKSDESDKAADARLEASKLADEAAPKLATLTVGVSGDAPLQMSVDGVDIPGEAARAPRVLDPGHHVVAVKRPGESGRAEVDLAEGEHRTLEVPLAADQPAAPTPIAKGKLVPNALVFTGFGVAAVGVVLGAVTGTVAFTSAGAVKNECPQGRCPPSAHGDLNLSLAMGTTSTIALIVAGVGIVVGVVGLFTSKVQRPAARVGAIMAQGVSW